MLIIILKSKRLCLNFTMPFIPEALSTMPHLSVWKDVLPSSTGWSLFYCCSCFPSFFFWFLVFYNNPFCCFFTPKKKFVHCFAIINQEKSLQSDKFSFSIYLSYLVYARFTLLGLLFAAQVLNFMWLKFLLIWRYFRLWSLICGIEAPENMPKCINNCYNLEGFWKNWHASYNKWLVSSIKTFVAIWRKLLNVWVIFTFVAIWHDLEWKLLSWAWLTCLFFIPEMVAKSAANAFQVFI
ncbi:hypothetical protein Tsubulata_036533 [Turnera subulata]|uniref:Uncharacterized protein n=1 Tax=Turnera subulata TaxID=218843 RepID=A0A9Q0FUK4_9ROSI|nr:hypothetical protein Tsubulata_036533 [Turnera subulata]